MKKLQKRNDIAINSLECYAVICGCGCTCSGSDVKADTRYRKNFNVDLG